MKKILYTTTLFFVIACNSNQAQDNYQNSENTTPMENKIEKITKTDAEWKAELTEEQYSILRKHSTERAFTGEYNSNKDTGMYVCAGCKLELFESNTKFDSGTGWPSYFAPANKSNVEETIDKAYGMTRTEVHCARCNGHLGHLFTDGPKPTGLRYCINSASLEFIKK